MSISVEDVAAQNEEKEGVEKEEEEEVRPPSPANSRDGSITPTPEEDIDLDEPLTPRKIAEGWIAFSKWCIKICIVAVDNYVSCRSRTLCVCDALYVNVAVSAHLC